jgi:PST family polysaccharide transporter
MAIPKKAVLGALWSISTGYGARAVTLVSSLLVAKFLPPDEYGEVSLASVFVLTAYAASNCGLGVYVIAKQTKREVTAQATLWSLLLGAAALGLLVLLRHPLSDLIDAPGAAAYIPTLAAAAMIDRVAFMPDRILYRDMRFRTASLSRSGGEVLFGVSTVGFAAAGYGANAIVIATFLRSILKLIVVCAAVPRAEWLAWTRLDRAQAKDFFRFGLPITIAGLSDFGSRRWDNLLMSRLFGPGVAGMYNYAYNIADIPATQIGESIGDVLVPSFAEMDGPRRKDALLRAIKLVTFVVCPLAIGLGAVAPTLCKVVFDSRWVLLPSMLAILSILSVVRPVAWIVGPYLQVYNKPDTMMALELSKTLLLLASFLVLGTLGGPLAACAAPGVAFTFNALTNLWVVKRMEGVGISKTLLPLLPPLLACAPMAAAVVGIRYGLAHVGHVPPVALLAAECVGGGVVFVVFALVVARSASRELIDLFRRRRGQDAAPASAPA